MRFMLLCCTWKDERMGEDEDEDHFRSHPCRNPDPPEASGSLPVCAGCRQRIYDEQYLQALNTDWHTVCFRLETRRSLAVRFQQQKLMGQLAELAS
ncbi:hypothetical protein AOLI_G00218440 [Acnodon oligacanthus]